MARKLNCVHETPSQTAGPYVHIGLVPRAAGFKVFEHELGQEIAGPDCQGERITVEGRVLDGAGAPVTDVLIEVWQANAAGHYNDPNAPPEQAVEPGFSGFGRVVPDFDTGVFSFQTVKPGPAGGLQAPHLNLWLVARGINLGLNTRMYFGDESTANAADPLLARIDSPARRGTLIASHAGPEPFYCFDIHLQGASETVFLDI